MDPIVTALEHRAPLTAVPCTAQADDTRDEAERALLTQPGQKETYMLLPDIMA